MTNQLTQDAEGSETIENTAIDTTGSTETTAAGSATAAPAQETASAPIEVPAATDAPTSGFEAPAEQAPPAQQTAESSAPSSATPAFSTNEEPDETLVSGEMDFGAILQQFEQEQTVFHQGELVEGKVVGITDRGVLVDFGYKSEGYVPVEEFTSATGEMMATVGETVEVIIRNIHSGDGAPLLSRSDAVGRKVWDEIESAFNAETPVTGRVVDKTKGGLKVDINGIEAFLPGSQIDSRPIRGLDTYIGQDIEAKIIKFSRRRNNIVLSRKVITDVVVNEQKAQTLSNIEIGHIVNGTIKNLTEYGAFVDIGGIDGLLHVTDMSWGRIHHPGDQFKVGEELQVKVLKLDREKEKVSLGFKQLQPDPWSTVVEVYPVSSKMNGNVSSVTDYGVFVELEPGVEGLVHVSEISWSRRSQSPKKMFQKGQEVEVQVLGVDTVEKRISLGMKQFQDNPWDTVDIRYPVGAKVAGRVRNITDFGAFVELEEGIDGLVHVSDISWGKKIKHPKDVLKKDQEVEAIVTSIDKRGQRLSLSMKDLTPSAWEGFVATHRPGDVVRGKVSRFTNFGVFVELGEGLEGLCHISELSDERVENPESVAALGQEMDFKILRIEPHDQKIGLSHRAVGKEDEPGVVDSRIYSTEAKGGMASLGELANLRLGDADAPPAAEEDPEEKKRAKQAAKEAKAAEFAAKEAARAEADAAEADTKSSNDTAVTDEASEAPVEAATATEELVIEEAPASEEAPADTDNAPGEAAGDDTVEKETSEAAEPLQDADSGTSQEAPASEETASGDETAASEEAAAGDQQAETEGSDAAAPDQMASSEEGSPTDNASTSEDATLDATVEASDAPAETEDGSSTAIETSEVAVEESTPETPEGLPSTEDGTEVGDAENGDDSDKQSA